MFRVITVCLLAALFAGPVVAQPPSSSRGVMLLAHGGSPEWNGRVEALAREANQRTPVEVAFGMAARGSLESALRRLQARGVTEVLAVPLFVSSWSSVIRSTEYLLGLRAEAPADLAIFAKMDHSMHGAGSPEGHACVAPCDGTAPIPVAVTVRMTEALNRHPLVGAILADRTRAISTDPQSEAVILVAHGPVPDDDNRRWLEDMAPLADQVRASAPYAAVHALTVRDDAGPALREEARRELRAVVERETSAGRRVLIVPHLLSFGGIERGIRTRLEGLSYTMTTQALMPDDRLLQWVLEQAGQPQ